MKGYGLIKDDILPESDLDLTVGPPEDKSTQPPDGNSTFFKHFNVKKFIFFLIKKKTISLMYPFLIFFYCFYKSIRTGFYFLFYRRYTN